MFNKLGLNQHLFNEQVPALRATSDSFATDDNISLVATYLRNFTESFSFTDTISNVATYLRTFSQSFSFTDSLADKIFNRMSQIPTILSATTKRFFAGSSSIIRPERG